MRPRRASHGSHRRGDHDVLIPAITASALILSIWLIDRQLRRLVLPKICEIFENMPPFNVAGESCSSEAEIVSFPTADGLTLTGSVLLPRSRPPKGLLLFFPELNGNHGMSLRYCAGAIDAGFAILAFDFRNQGDSGHQPGYSPIHWITEYEMQDVAAVLEFIETQDELATLPLVALGVSRGGVAALAAASRYPRIRAVVADSSFSTLAMVRHYVGRFATLIVPGWFYRLLPEYHIRQALRDSVRLSEQRRNCEYVLLENEMTGLTDTPVLIIAGSRDSYVQPEMADHLQKICGPTAELWLVDGAKHNMARQVQTQEYDRRITQHFLKAIEQDAVEPAVTAPGRSARDRHVVTP